MKTLTVKAENVKQGDSLPTHERGYVAEDAENAESNVSFYSGFQPVALTGYTLITYHNADGDECYLIVPCDSLVEVER